MTSILNKYSFHIGKIIFSITVLVSVFVMISWYTESPFFLSIIPGESTMKFNTALLFLLTALAFCANVNIERFRITAAVLESVVIMVSALTLLQYFINQDFGVDDLLVEDIYSTSMPGRMSPATALCFLITGVSFIGLKSNKKGFTRISQLLISAVTLISLVSMVAYILKVSMEDRMFFLQTMAVHTSVLFFMLSIAIQMLLSPGDLSVLVLGKSTGSVLFRKLLPLIVVSPVFFGVLFILGAKHNLFSIEFGVSLYTVIIMLFGIGYVYFIARRMNTLDFKRLEVEQSIIKSNERLDQFKTALDEIAIVAITDKKGVINYVNDQFCDISQYSREELIGNTHAMVNSGFHDQAFFNDLWLTISKGEMWEGEVVNRAKDGSLYYVQTVILPLKNHDGVVEQYMAVRQDVTAQKKSIELLRTDYIKKLEYKNKELEQFVYIASHDLQEPLRTIRSFSELINKKYSENADDVAKKGLGFISEAANRMSGLIKDLLDYSRIGKERELTVVNLDELLAGILSDLSALIEQSGAKITVNRLPEIKGYKTELRLLFQNLLSNALKFTTLERKPVVEINAVAEKGKLIVSVKDNGIGIEKEHLERVFVMFQRLNHRNDYEGSGIGLAHCQKIVEMHQGKIWVESDPGKGSTFYFTLKI